MEDGWLSGDNGAGHPTKMNVSGLASIPDWPEGGVSWLPGNQSRGPGILLGSVGEAIISPDDALIDMDITQKAG